MKLSKIIVAIAVLGGSAWLSHAAGAETPKKAPSAPAGKTSANGPIALPEAQPDKSILTGPVNWTGISGYTAPAPFKLSVEGNDFMAAYSIQWWENDDQIYAETGRQYPAAPLHSSAKGISLGCRKVQKKP